MRTEAVRLAPTWLAPCCLLFPLGACGGESDPPDAATPDSITTTVAAVESAPNASPTTAPAAATTTIGTGASSPPGVAPLPGPAAPPIGDGVPIVTEPAPEEMCEEGSVPQAAAYDLDDGTFRWVSCADEPAWRTVRAVSDDAVYIASDPGELTALDPASGDVLDDAPPPPPIDDRSASPQMIEVDGVFVSGEQISRVWATDANGVELWTRPGGWVYGNVWAIDDGAVFAVENHSDLVAYDVQTGEVRWVHRGDPYAEGLWPWHAEGQRVYSMWANLQVRSTVDGTVIWATGYPWVGEPTGSVRMSGVGIDGESVFIAFASATSGGD